MMTTRTWRFGPARVSVDIPEPLVRFVRRARGRERMPKQGCLVLQESVPELHVQQRDADESMRFFRARQDDPTQVGHGLSGDGRPLRAPQPKSELAQRVAEFAWYHTIELPGEIVTPGIFDHRSLVPHYGIPERLDGNRVLDVATFDGFWAFEFERRGADVTALDIERLSHTDMPPQIRSLVLAEGLDREIGLGFRLAHEALGSRIKRVVSSVYDLDPSVHGTFDLVHSGDLLLHLERPLDALRAIRSVTGGRAMISDSYLPLPSDSQGQHLVQYFGGWWSSTWWLPSLDALAQMILDAGFSDVRVHRIYNLAAADESAGFWRAVLIANP